MNGEQPLASTLWLLARFVGNHVGWLVGSSSLRQVQVNVFPKLYWRRRKKLTHSAKALNALFPKPIGTDAIVLTRTKNSADFLFESLYGPVRRLKLNPQKRRPNSDRCLRDSFLRSHAQTAKANATYQN